MRPRRDPKTNRVRIACVAGMHRSGTSVTSDVHEMTAEVASRLAAYLGLPPPSPAVVGHVEAAIMVGPQHHADATPGPGSNLEAADSVLDLAVTWLHARDMTCPWMLWSEKRRSNR